MKRPAATIVALFLAGCSADPRAPVTPKQASQANVMATKPTPLEKLAASEEHASEWPVWLWDHTVGSVTATALNITPTGVIAGQLQINTQAVVSGTAGKVVVK